MRTNRALIAIAGLILLAGSVAAYGMMGYGYGARDGTGPISNLTYEQRLEHQDTVSGIVTSGTYQDLVDLRAQDGVDYLPMIESAEDFAAFQDSRGAGLMRGRAWGANGTGFARGHGWNRGAGCPMWD